MWYFRFRILGLRIKKPLRYKDLILYSPQKYNGYSFLETMRRFKDASGVKQKVERLIELLQIFYLTWITYFGIYRRKNSTEKWEFVEATTTFNIPSEGLHPLYDEIFLDDFLKLTFNRKRYRDQIFRSNILLINARLPGMLFENKFLLRWIALESLMRENKGIWQNYSRNQFKQIKRYGRQFAKKIRSEKIRNIFLDKINRTEGDVKFREAFKKFVTKRHLPVTYDDITDCKKLRDKIVHYGSMRGVIASSHYNSLSNGLESLIRNLLAYYLGLKFNRDWKRWWSCSLWPPQKR